MYGSPLLSGSLHYRITVGRVHELSRGFYPAEDDTLDIAALLAQAGEHHAARRFHQAEIIYRQVLGKDPTQAGAWHGLGLLAREAGQLAAAASCLRRAAALAPDDTSIPLDLGRICESLGAHEQASELYGQLLERNPGLFSAALGLGRALSRQGRHEEALIRLQTALALERDNVDALNELGVALARAGQMSEAQALFEHTIQIWPEQAAAYNNLAGVFQRLERWTEAERWLCRAITLDPTDADLHFNLGSLLRRQGRLGEAVVSFRNAIRFLPSHPAAHPALGTTLFDLGRSAEACEVLRQAVALAPGSAEGHNDLGNVYRSLEREQEAVACYQRALQAEPRFAPAHANLGNLLSEQSRTEEARRHYEEAHRLQPNPRLRLISQTLLPVIYDSVEHLWEARQRLVSNLDQMHEDGLRLDPTREQMPTLFYLAYQGLNDRDACAAMARLAPSPFQPRPRSRPAGKVRIGFLSRYLRTHTIGQLSHGLIARLSREHFEVIVLSIGPPDEGLGRAICRSADRFLALPTNLEIALNIVANLRLDVLFYPDVGMDSLTYTLAFGRLARVQCVTWGHPVTTGLPTMDYFISSADLEQEESDTHYSERLVRLSRLAVVYPRPHLAPQRKDREAFGLPADAHLYGCPQTLFKFHPEFDALLANILHSDPHGLLVLIEGKYEYWTELLRRRFVRTLGEAANRVRFLPRLSRPDYLSLLETVNVLLDPLHFGGGNSSYEALGLGTPIVTLPSGFLRGRLTYALYRQMDFLDLVAADAADYVAKAVRIGTDPSYRNHLHRSLQTACAVLFDDVTGVRELERFLLDAVARS
jgi:predicted O-linked N-acetylglucosamine transferase (SPINDLY family)